MRSSAHFKSQYGFTLIEVLVCLAILALTLTVATSVLRAPSDRLALSKSSQEMVTAMRTARGRAIARNETVDFTIDMQKNTYSWSTFEPRALPAGARLTLQVAAFGRMTEPYANLQGVIRFYPDGTATGADLRIEYRQASRQVTVNWLTGYVTSTP